MSDAAHNDQLRADLRRRRKMSMTFIIAAPQRTSRRAIYPPGLPCRPPPPFAPAPTTSVRLGFYKRHEYYKNR
jgi:hypothetical protein